MSQRTSLTSTDPRYPRKGLIVPLRWVLQRGWLAILAYPVYLISNLWGLITAPHPIDLSQPSFYAQLFLGPAQTLLQRYPFFALPAVLIGLLSIMLVLGALGRVAHQDQRREDEVLHLREKDAETARQADVAKAHAATVAGDVAKAAAQVETQRAFEQAGFTPFDPAAERAKYLGGMRLRFTGLSLPVDLGDLLDLDAIYQPLELINNPIIAEAQSEQERRALEDEQRRSAEDPLYQPKTPPESLRERRGADRRSPRPPTHETAKDAQEALAKSRSGRLVVLGNPGTGKTTFLRKIVADALKATAEDAPLPVFISLPDLARSGLTEDLRGYFKRIVREMGADERYADTLWAAVQAGQGLVCLDGLDEVRGDQRPGIIAMINRDAPHWGGAWIIGSRFSDYKGQQFAAGQFFEWELKPLRPDQQLELAGRLLPALHRALHGRQGETLVRTRPQAFLAALGRRPQTTAWGTNPLLLSLAAYVYVKQGTLPETRSELYRLIVAAVVASRAEKLKATADTLLPAVAELALQLYLYRGRTFSRRDLTERLRDVRQALGENWLTDEMTTDIIACGLLEPVAVETYGFRHQTFQEYLVASALAYWLTDPKQRQLTETWALIRRVRTYSRWSEPLRLLVGVLAQERVPEGPRVVQTWLTELAQAAQARTSDPGALILALAIRSLSELPPSLASTYRSVVAIWAALLIEAARRGRGTLQARLIQLATDLHGLDRGLFISVVPQLVQALGNSNEYVRQAVAEALGQMGDASVVPQLVQALGDSNDDVRRAVAQALGQLGDTSVVPQLVQALGDDRWEVRQGVAQALGQLGDASVVPQLVQALGDSEWNVRQGVAQALGKLGDASVVPQLVQALGDEYSSVRSAVAEALGQLGDASVVPQLVHALGDEYSSVRSAVAEALGQLGDASVVPQLVQALGDEYSSVRSAVAEALGQLGDASVVPQLVHALWDVGETRISG